MPESSQPPENPSNLNLEFSKLTQELRESTDLAIIEPVLEKLKGVLMEHFKGEEAADGLFKTILAKAPHHSHILERLIEEHRCMLSSLEDLSARVRNFKKDFETITKDFGAKLERHESEEVELYNDTLTLEYGGQG